jgi:hypothetical protein
MRTSCGYNEQTIGERHGGCASVFRDEDRGRPVAIKVVRLYQTNLEVSLSVRSFQSRWGGFHLIRSLVEVFQRGRRLETPPPPEYPSIAWCECGLKNPQIRNGVRVDGQWERQRIHSETQRGQSSAACEHWSRHCMILVEADVTGFFSW